MRKVHIVLLGATGFVGSALVRAARGRPDEIVLRALVRGHAERVEGGVDVRLGALEALPRELFFPEPHIVVHLASKQIDHDGTGFACNVRHAQRLMAALGSGCRGVIMGSSASVYGPGPQERTSESAPTLPGTALARSRLQSEQVIERAARERGIASCMLRPRFIVGRGDVQTLPRLARALRPGLMLGNGAQRLSIIDVDDYAEICVRLARAMLESRPTPRVLNVAYAQPISLGAWAELLGCRPRVQLPLPAAVLHWAASGQAPHGRRALEQLREKLALFGLSHHLDVRALEVAVGRELCARDPRAVITRACAARS